MQFLCQITAFLYMPTSATVQMLKLHTVRSTLIFTAVIFCYHGDSRNLWHTTKIAVKATVIVNTWLSKRQRRRCNKCYNKCLCLRPLLCTSLILNVANIYRPVTIHTQIRNAYKCVICNVLKNACSKFGRKHNTDCIWRPLPEEPPRISAYTLYF